MNELIDCLFVEPSFHNDSRKDMMAAAKSLLKTTASYQSTTHSSGQYASILLLILQVDTQHLGSVAAGLEETVPPEKGRSRVRG